MLDKMKKERYVTNDFVSDDRGHAGWKITRPPSSGEEDKDQVTEILYTEEVVAMLLGHIKMLAEIQAGGGVRDCVITIPSWFTYEQRLLVRDAAELVNLNVL